jgi:hypothetical protein
MRRIDRNHIHPDSGEGLDAFFEFVSYAYCCTTAQTTGII